MIVRNTLLTTSSDSSSGGMCVMVPQVRVSMREVLFISRDSPKSATFAVMPSGDSYSRTSSPSTLQQICARKELLECLLWQQAEATTR